MIILKIKIATAFDTSSTVSFEDHPAHITRDRLPLAGWTLGFTSTGVVYGVAGIDVTALLEYGASP
jgi:hypothetical protein